MKLNAPFIQVENKLAYLNVEQRSDAIYASSVIYEKTIHLIAWNKNEANYNYTLILIGVEDFPYWMQHYRQDYGKVLKIVEGGVENAL